MADEIPPQEPNGGSVLETLEPEQPLKVIAYNRVSTMDQVDFGYSLDLMKERLVQYAVSRGWTLAEEDIYEDAGESAKGIENRKSYQAMMKRLEEDETIDGLLVFKNDRIHRNMFNAMQFVEKMNELDKQYISVTESIDTSTAHGRLFLTLLFAFAQFESEQLAERVTRGMIESVKQGYHHGRINPTWWKINWQNEDAARLGAKGLIVPKKLLFQLEQDKKTLSWNEIVRRYEHPMGSCRTALEGMEKWREDPIHGWLISQKTKVTTPKPFRPKMKKSHKKQRERVNQVLERDRGTAEATGVLRFATLKQIADEGLISYGALSRLAKEGVFDLSYRKNYPKPRRKTT